MAGSRACASRRFGPLCIAAAVEAETAKILRAFRHRPGTHIRAHLRALAPHLSAPPCYHSPRLVICPESFQQGRSPTAMNIHATLAHSCRLAILMCAAAFRGHLQHQSLDGSRAPGPTAARRCTPPPCGNGQGLHRALLRHGAAIETVAARARPARSRVHRQRRRRARRQGAARSLPPSRAPGRAARLCVGASARSRRAA